MLKALFQKTKQQRLVRKNPILIFVLMTSILGFNATAQDTAVSQLDKNLYKFAVAQCLMSYFERRGYDAKDIKGISGGLVETGKHSIETYENISNEVRSSKNNVTSKQNIDPHLNKCFHLEANVSLQRLLKIKND